MLNEQNQLLISFRFLMSYFVWWSTAFPKTAHFTHTIITIWLLQFELHFRVDRSRRRFSTIARCNIYGFSSPSRASRNLANNISMSVCNCQDFSFTRSIRCIPHSISLHFPVIDLIFFNGLNAVVVVVVVAITSDDYNSSISRNYSSIIMNDKRLWWWTLGGNQDKNIFIYGHICTFIV